MKVDNPLNKFRSYSHHHVLMMTNSSTVLEILKEADHFPISDLQKQNTGSFGVSRKRLSRLDNGRVIVEDAPDYDPTDHAFVVISNGTQDSEIFIETVEWMNMFAPNFNESQGVDAYTSMALDGNMTIREPRGTRFFQFLDQAYDLLGVDPASAIFICKTFFVGYTDSDSLYQAEVISNVAPLGFFMYDCKADFDATGARYQLTFVGMNNGAGKLPQYQYIMDNDIGGISTSETNGLNTVNLPLARVLESLFEKIQNQYDRSVEEQRKRNPSFDSEYRTVKYKLVLDDAYTRGQYLVDNCKQFNAETTDNGGGVIAFPPGTTLENAIDKLMQSSSAVLRDAQPSKQTDNNGLNTRHIYKILTTIEAGPLADNEDSAFTVVHTIKRYEISSVGDSQASLSFVDIDPDDPSILEYDYLFTGNNTEVLKFDMSFDAGLLFLMSYRSPPTIPSLTDEIAVTNTDSDKAVEGNDYDYKNVRKQKLFLPAQRTQNPIITHMRDPIAGMDFRTALNSYAALGALDASLRIRGNPELMNSILMTPSELIAGTNPSATVIPEWATKGALMKVNVKMPSGDPNAPERYEDFWYQGAYMILSVKNILRSGDFTQELELIPTFNKTDFGFGANDETRQNVDDVISVRESKENALKNPLDSIPLFQITDPFNTNSERTVSDSQYFNLIVRRTLGHEGGYVDNPSDPGGATNFGISFRTLSSARWRDENGFLIGDKDQDGQISVSDIQNLTEDDAVNIYFHYFWKPYRFDEMPTIGLAYQLFDMGVNAGPGNAQKLLQRAINDLGGSVVVDGRIGDDTIAAVRLFDPVTLEEQYKQRRRWYYQDLVVRKPEQAVFLNGWLNRVNGGDYGNGFGEIEVAEL